MKRNDPSNLKEYKSLAKQLTREEWDLRDQLASRPLTLREAKILRNNS